jgi:hypothetical protein
MKKSRAFALATVALIIGFLVARWCTAQPAPQQTGEKRDNYDFGAMDQLASFVSYLQETGQTNTLERFNRYLNSSLASRQYADLGTALVVLQRLRDGRTDQACNLLEISLNGDIVGFATSYRQLPTSLREQTSLKLLSWAKDYRAKYPFHDQSQIVNDGVTSAFKILDEQTAK